MPLLILIADDDPGIRLAVKDYLELSGYSVVTAKNGQEALSLLEIYHPHLLVSDIKMPRTDGYELVAQIRQRPEFRLLPVVFLTEKNTTDERIRGYQAGCDLYLPKPFEMEELGAVIRNLLERSQILATEIHISRQQPEKPPQAKKSDPQSQPSGTNSNSRPQSKTPDLNPAPELTGREKQALELLAQGLSNVDIGNELHLSPRTVEKYVSSLLRKTETNNRAELVRFALEHKLVD